MIKKSLLLAAVLVVFMLEARGENGPVGWWDFNEGSGQVVKDRAGQNNGQLGLTGEPDAYDPTWVKTGEGNYALEFDNIERKNFVLIGRGKGKFDQQAGKGFSVSAWIKVSGKKKDEKYNKKYGDRSFPLPSYLISKHMISDPHGGWNIAVTPERVECSVKCNDAAGLSCFPFIADTLDVPEAVNAVYPRNLNDGHWHQVFVIWKVEDFEDFIGEVTLYVDGIKVAEGMSKYAVPSWPESADLNLIIGLDQMVYQAYLNDPAWSTGFSGLIDEVKVFNCWLDDADVKKEYAHTKNNYGK